MYCSLFAAKKQNLQVPLFVFVSFSRIIHWRCMMFPATYRSPCKLEIVSKLLLHQELSHSFNPRSTDCSFPSLFTFLCHLRPLVELHSPSLAVSHSVSMSSIWRIQNEENKQNQWRVRLMMQMRLNVIDTRWHTKTSIVVKKEIYFKLIWSRIKEYWDDVSRAIQ